MPVAAFPRPIAGPVYEREVRLEIVTGQVQGSVWEVKFRAAFGDTLQQLVRHETGQVQGNVWEYAPTTCPQ